MDPRYYDASGRIDHEAVKAYALALRSQAIDSAFRRLVAKVRDLIDGLRLDAPSHGMAHFGHSRHRSG